MKKLEREENDLITPLNSNSYISEPRAPSCIYIYLSIIAKANGSRSDISSQNPHPEGARDMNCHRRKRRIYTEYTANIQPSLQLSINIWTLIEAFGWAVGEVQRSLLVPTHNNHIISRY